MRQLLDLDRWPVDALDGARGRALVARCRNALHEAGMVSLDALIRPAALRACVAEVGPLFDTAAFTHARDHNIYFDDEIEGPEAGHPALSRVTTVNRTICGDQIPASAITRIYEWQPLIDFLAAAMEKPQLYPMADPLGRINVMAYRAGERLNWHFDRAEFTITILLQAPLSGGANSSIAAGCGARRTRTTQALPACSPAKTTRVADRCRSHPARSSSSRAGTPRTARRRSKAPGRGSSPCSPTTRRRT